MRMKQIVIFGSTGSVGTKALQICERNPESFKVIGLTTNTNIKKLLEQINQFRPRYVAITDDNARNEFTKYKPPFVQVLSVDELSCIKVDCVINGMVGISGLKPSMNVLKNGGTLGIANKEPIVAAGRLLREQAERYGSTIIPVDSEHSAIFQSLNGEPAGRIEKILLTASGGPFRGRTREQLQNIQVEDALKHPNWSMGRKITIDSSTLVNKGLEVMEVKWLFGVDLDQIQVIVHPQSIIHSAVQYVDGAVIAQLGTPDMKLPIQYALFYPDRRPMPGKRLDFYELAQITFEKPDMETFFGLKLAYDAQRIGGSMPTVYNAANEKAVGLFLDRKIAYLQIPELIREAMEQHKVIENPNVEEILETEASVYDFIEKVYSERQ